MVAPKTTSKIIGKYIVYKWDYFDGVYNYKTDKIGKYYDYTQVSVFISGEEKSLQRSEDYKSKLQAQDVYKKLSSLNSIERWIKETW